MPSYKKQYGGRFVRHLVYHWIEESWYRELSQKCLSARAYVLMLSYALVKTGFYSKNQKICFPILVTLLKMRPHHSQSSRENPTPLVSHKEVPSPPLLQPGIVFDWQNF